MSYEMSIVYPLQDDTKNQGKNHFFLTRCQKSRPECSPDLNTLPEALVGHVKREATDWMQKIGGRSLAHQKKHWIVLSLENRYIDIGIG